MKILFKKINRGYRFGRVIDLGQGWSRSENRGHVLNVLHDDNDVHSGDISGVFAGYGKRILENRTSDKYTRLFYVW